MEKTPLLVIRLNFHKVECLLPADGNARFGSTLPIAHDHGRNEASPFDRIESYR
jgi:hypothetical protein